MGLATADRYLRAAAGDPHLLQVPRCGRGPLLARRRLPERDALGTRTEILAAAAERANVGQPSRALHPRQRRGDEPGYPQEHRRAAALLSARYSSGRERRPRNPRATHL